MNTSHPHILKRLSVMMFLQFFIWGAWLISIPLYCSAQGMGNEKFWAFTAGPLAAMCAPFFTGLVADRFFNTEKVLAALFLLAGLFMLMMGYVGELTGPITKSITDPDTGKQIINAMTVNLPMLGEVDKGTVFSNLITAHSLCFMPSLALTASLAFAHLPKGNDQFPLVRLWGTIGWIVSGAIIVSLLFKAEEGAIQFWIGGGAGILLALFCLTLPKTPAPLKGKKLDFRSLFFIDALKELKRPNFFVFMICSFLICIPLQAYYANLQGMMKLLEMPYIGFMKNLGTIVEALMMFAMPFFYRKLGIKKMIAIGIGAWVLRYALFAFGASEGMVSMVIFGILLHGLCYDFFFVTGQIYVDKSTEKSIRAQAQSMNVFFTQGLGMYLGAQFNFGYLGPWVFKDEKGNAVNQGIPSSLEYWPTFWWVLAAISAVILLIFLVSFRYKDKKEDLDDFSH